MADRNVNVLFMEIKNICYRRKGINIYIDKQ